MNTPPQKPAVPDMSPDRSPDTPPDDAATAAHSAHGQKPSARRRRLLWIGVALGSVFIAVIAAAISATTWIWRTDAGTAWALARVPHVTVTGLNGNLAGATLAAESVVVKIDAETLELHGVLLRAPRWQWRPRPGAWLGLKLDDASAQRVVWRSSPPTGKPSTVPQSLRLPLHLQVPVVRIAELQIDDLAPVQAVSAQDVEVGAEGGAWHRIGRLQGRMYDIDIIGAQARMATDAPLTVAVQLPLQAPRAAQPWQATVAMAGPLAAPQLTARLQGTTPGSAVTLDADAALRPFDVWPLGDVKLRTRALDLSQLHRNWPRTALDADATLKSSASQHPVRADVTLQNRAPARWDQGGLPVRALTLSLQGRFDAVDSVRIDTIDMTLGDARSEGGRVQGNGDWQAADANFKLQIEQLRPSVLDARAPAMGLSGALTLALSGLPAAGGAAASPVEPKAHAQANVKPNAAVDANADAKADANAGIRADVKADLQGRVDGQPDAVALAVAAQLQGNTLTLATLQARAAGAEAQLDGRVAWRMAPVRVCNPVATKPAVAPAAAPCGNVLSAVDWQLKGQLREFDPSVWWPGTPGSAWRRGPHRLNAVLDTAAGLPAAALSNPLQHWRQLTGHVQLQVQPSVLAGVALQGDVAYGDRGTALSAASAPAGNVALHATLSAAGNQLLLNAQADARGTDPPRVHLQADAPQLAALAPLFSLEPKLARWAPRAGMLQADVNSEPTASGTRVSATVDAADWRAEQLQLDRASLRASGTLGDAASPLSAQADVLGLRIANGRLERLNATLDGTLRAHRISLVADSTLRPPEWVDRMAGQRPGNGSRVQLAVAGGWEAQAGASGALPWAAGRWQGRVDDLQGLPLTFPTQRRARGGAAAPAASAGSASAAIAAAPASGPAARGGGAPARTRKSPLAAAPSEGRASTQAATPSGAATLAAAPSRPAPTVGAPWLSAQNLAMAVDFDANGELRAARAEPGRIVLFGSAIGWTEALWQQAPGAAPRFALQAALEPITVAPLLDRLQPDLGWRGDLTVAGHLRVRAAERFEADAVFERGSGDLSVADDVNDPASPQRPLGLSALRIGLTAQDGTWQFSQAFAGQQVGEMASAIRVRTAPGAMWPPADAPLDGTAQMRVAQLGAWGGWLPPGWRLGGELSMSASIGGRFGAPEIDGQIAGRALSLRNVLQGVQWNDGTVDIRLSGLAAQIERFDFKGGNGSLKVEGDGVLGAKPRAQLRMAADHFQVLGRVDRRIVASGNATLNVSPGDLAMDGTVHVDEGLIDFSRGNAPSLPDDVDVIERGTVAPKRREAEARAADEAARRSTRVDLLVELGDKLRIRGRGLDTLLRGSFAMTTPGNRLAANGSVRAEQGTYNAYGQKLAIQRGTLTFIGPLEDPRLDIFAVRPNTDVVVGVEVTGSALVPRVRLASDPEMSDNDKLSWLMLGRAPTGLGQADTALLQRAAMALIAGEGEGPTDALLRQIGLTDFSVSQTGEGELRETVVTLGRQISQHWYLGYERSVNAATGSFQVIYRIAQRLTVRAQAGEDNAVDVVWSWRWQ